MTKEELEKRIEKKNKDIEKINKRISKWSDGLRPEDIAIVEPFGNCIYGTAPRSVNWRDYHGTPEYQEARKNYDNYLDMHKDIPNSDDWNKGPNIEELFRAYRDLGEAKYTLSKYQNELLNLDKFNKEEKIQILWDFLQTWRETSYKYYKNNAALYGKLNSEYKDALDIYENSIDYEDKFNYYKSRHIKDWNIKYILEKDFKEKYYENIDSITYEISDRRGNVDEEKLNKLLDKEVRRKYEKLVADVTEKAGEIIDASNLRIDAKGEIAGLIKGTKNTVELWATISGGYNIQRVHIRSYVRIR